MSGLQPLKENNFDTTGGCGLQNFPRVCGYFCPSSGMLQAVLWV